MAVDASSPLFVRNPIHLFKFESKKEITFTLPKCCSFNFFQFFNIWIYLSCTDLTFVLQGDVI